MAAGQSGEDDSRDAGRKTVLTSRVVYEIDRSSKQQKIRVAISGTRFDRSISLVVKQERKVRTITFPNTVKQVQGTAFVENKSLRAAVLNEGLETLGECKDGSYGFCGGVFSNT